MVNYMCKRCGKEFKKKFNWEVHKKRKYQCKIKEELYTNDIDKTKCNYCGKKYSTVFNLNKHTKLCKVKCKIRKNKNDETRKKEKKAFMEECVILRKKNKEINDKNRELNDKNRKLLKCLEKEKRKTYNLEKKIKEMESTSECVMYINSGEEDIDFLLDATCIKIFKRKYMSMFYMVKYVKFNRSREEYNNIRITNKSSGNMSIFINGRWTIVKAKEAIDEIMYDLFHKFLRRFEKMCNDNLIDKTDIHIKRYMNFCDEYQKNWDNPGGDKKKKKMIRDRILSFVYDYTKELEK
jgi:hypothetical protein